MAHAAGCDGSGDLYYDDAVKAVADGSLSISFTPAAGGGTVTATVSNQTPCSVSVSLGTFKMFSAWQASTQSQEEFFSEAPAQTVAASSSATFTAATPSCAYQYDVWYGPAPHALVDNVVYGSYLAGNTSGEDHYCTKTAPPPPAITASCTGSQPDADALSASWSAQASGGTPPYSYSWSAYDDVASYGAGSTRSSSFSDSYESAGSKQAIADIVDSAGATTTAECSVTLKGAATPPPAQQPPTAQPTTTPPIVNITNNNSTTTANVSTATTTNIISTTTITNNYVTNTSSPAPVYYPTPQVIYESAPQTTYVPTPVYVQSPPTVVQTPAPTYVPAYVPPSQAPAPVYPGAPNTGFGPDEGPVDVMVFAIPLCAMIIGGIAWLPFAKHEQA